MSARNSSRLLALLAASRASAAAASGAAIAACRRDAGAAAMTGGQLRARRWSGRDIGQAVERLLVKRAVDAGFGVEGEEVAGGLGWRSWVTGAATIISDAGRA